MFFDILDVIRLRAVHGLNSETQKQTMKNEGEDSPKTASSNDLTSAAVFPQGGKKFDELLAPLLNRLKVLQSKVLSKIGSSSDQSGISGQSM